MRPVHARVIGMHTTAARGEASALEEMMSGAGVCSGAPAAGH